MSLQTFLFISVLVMCCCIVASEENDDETNFIPTHEWQVVKKGQKIPKGLHVRVNLEKGVTEAKLLDDDHKSKTQALLPVDVGDDEEFVLDREMLKESLKNIKSDDIQNLNPSDPNERFKSYEELKISLADLNLAPKQDSEVIADLLVDFEAQMKKENINLEKVLIIIEDLDYLSHQIDNAIEFVRQDGFNKIVYRNFNETDPEIKQMTLKLFGSLVQNNGKVQIYCLESGCLYKLLRLLAVEQNEIVKSAGISALGSLLRRFPLAQKSFIEQGGIAVLSKSFENDTNKIQIKIATLISDLWIENEEGRQHENETVNSQYKLVNFKDILLDNNWCENIDKMLLTTVLMNIEDHDRIEKCLLAMKTVKTYCHVIFDKSLLHELKVRYKTLAKLENSKSADLSNQDYFQSIYDIISEILSINNASKTEL